jgi:anti-sigma B factor antagonist
MAPSKHKAMILTLTTRRREPGITVLEIGGRVTIGRESSRIEAAVLKALDEGASRIVLDLNHVNWLDSTGVGVVAYCFGKASQAGAQLNVAAVTGRVREVFQITGLDRVIRFFPDVDSACEAFVTAAAAK